MKNVIFILKYTLHIILFFNLSFIYAEENLTRNPNDIHIRKGFTELLDGQIREYKFLDVAVTVRYLTKFSMEEIRQKFPNDVLVNWNIEYSIYTSIENAELAMVERLEMSNLYMHNIIDSPLAQGPIGDNCWYQLSVGSIQFLRNNIFISITPHVKMASNSSFDYYQCEWLAREIDTLILESKTISDANLIPTPKFFSIDIVSELPDSMGRTAVIKINTIDQSSQKLFIRKYASGFSSISESGYLTLFLNKKVDSSNDQRKANVRIWVWNEEHIFLLVEKEIPFNSN